MPGEDMEAYNKHCLAAARLPAALPSPSPELLVHRFSNAGIEYKVRY